MAFESAAKLVEILAEELKRSGADPHEFATMSGVSEARLTLLQNGAWKELTVQEIAAITEKLRIDFFEL